MGAAMLDGVGGHAGLFSNANDIGVIMQMYLNGGHYGGNYFLSPNTVTNFSKKQKRDSRRGLGFDKPNVDNMDKSNTGKLASPETFGHTGFTGTCAWADPKYNLVYVFLSNRVYPKSNNWRIVKDDVREKIHDVVYNAILKTEYRKKGQP